MHSAFNHLDELLPDDVPFFALLPEPEPAFLTSAFTAASAAAFQLQSVALRTEHDPVQVVWKKVSKTDAAQITDVIVLDKAMKPFEGHPYLTMRGEPASYLHMHTVGLIALAEMNASKNLTLSLMKRYERSMPY